MGMFDISDGAVAECTEKFRAMAQEQVGEPVVATAPFRRGGAAAGMAISRAGLGGVAYAANSLFNKKKAGDLPQLAIIGGAVFVIAALATDMLGLAI